MVSAVFSADGMEVKEWQTQCLPYAADGMDAEEAADTMSALRQR